MDNENIFNIILDLFNPTVIYQQLDGAVDIYMKIIVPMVIIISVAIRYLELQVDNLGEGASWSKAIKDVKTAIIFTGLYAGFGSLVIKFHVVLCKTMYAHGSLEVLLNGYHEFINEIENTNSQSWLDKASDFAEKYSVEAVVTRILHFLSYVLLVIVNVLLRIIYALGFCMLYLWGMFAVPTMATRLFNLASGWVRGCVALALWPIVEASIYILINPMFTQLGEKISGAQSEALASKVAALSLIYTFANILLMAVGVASFFIAVAISMNQNFLSGMGTSMMAAVAAGSSLVMNGTKLVRSRTGTTRNTASGLGSAFPGGGQETAGANSMSPGGSIDGLGSNPSAPSAGHSAPAMTPGADMTGNPEAVNQGAGIDAPANTPGPVPSNETADAATASQGQGTAGRNNAEMNKTKPIKGGSLSETGNVHVGPAESGISPKTDLQSDQAPQINNGAEIKPGINELAKT